MQPSQQLSTIEKSVTHLLIATKQLLECLTQWSRQTATEGEVSDVYVRLGYEFNIACRAFNAVGVETADLGPVPDKLRAILEDTLSQEASTTSLDKYLPRIRDIIINLLHGLKRKQQRLRSKQGRDISMSSSTPAPRTLSNGSSTTASTTNLTQMLDDVPSSRPNARMSERRNGSGNLQGMEEHGVPPRTSSVQNLVASPTRDENGASPMDATNRRNGRGVPPSLSDSSLSSNTMQTLPVLPPGEYNLPIQGMSTHDHESQFLRPPPPPPPKEEDALAALQRGGDLERRASRRYSAYQISKHLGASPSGVPMLPPAQTTPIPNRGRDVRESLNAVRTRTSLLTGSQRPNHKGQESSPTRGHAVPRRISEEPSQSNDRSRHHQTSKSREGDSPIVETPEDKLGPSFFDANGTEQPALGATLNGPPSNGVNGLTGYDSGGAEDSGIRKDTGKQQLPRPDSTVSYSEVYRTARRISPQPQEYIADQSPQAGKELTLFLQYKSKIKKYVIPEGSNDLTIARLQLGFIEKFAWDTHNNGAEMPEIYIQDPVSGVRHELEDMSDVRDRSVLVLNVEVLDEVKKHIDEGLSGLRKMVEGVRTVVDGQQSVIKQVSEQQQNTARNMASIAAAPSPGPSRIGSVDTKRSWGTKSSSLPSDPSNVSEIDSLRRDLAVVRQTFSSFTADINASVSAIREKASSVKAVAIASTVPELDASSGRAYVNKGKESCKVEVEAVMNLTDNLQDTIEDLRKDVVTRGVRPLPRQLETVSKEISAATAEVKKMQELFKREKPIWTKIWEKELQLVCDDREFLTMQEDLVLDLEDDLTKVTHIFALVEEATKQQNLHSTTGVPVTLRSTSRGLAAAPDVDPRKAKDGVLGEVRALQPNHETRLEAIERAEKARQMELETRREGEFKKELGSFVDEGKLRKSGGVEEAERLRKAKDERIRRDGWEKQQAKQAGQDAEGEAAETSQSPAASEELSASPEPVSEDQAELNGTVTESSVEQG